MSLCLKNPPGMGHSISSYGIYPCPKEGLLRRFAILGVTTLMLVLALPGLAFAQAPSPADLSLAMDTMWVLVAAVLVIFMQAGFAMLEGGFSSM